MKRKMTLCFALLILAGSTLWAADRYPIVWTDVYVSPAGSDITGTGTALLPWKTIQHAVVTAGFSDVIHIAAGTYDEQVAMIGKNQTLIGVGDATLIQPSAATILATFYTYPAGTYWPGTVMASTILVTNGSAVIKNLKVDGAFVTSVPSGAERLAGILYGEASGTLDNVTVTSIKTTLYADRSYGMDLSATGTARAIEVKNCRITDWARNGIQVMGASLVANIHDNVLQGPGTIGPANVPNGIVFIHGPGGNATQNTIHMGTYINDVWGTCGVLVYDPCVPGIVIERNNIYDMDNGVGLANSANDVIVRNNNLHNNKYGVSFEAGAVNNAITGNTIVSNSVTGIVLDGATNTPAGTPPATGNYAHNNNISGNGAGVINYDNTKVFDALNNWWGTANGPYDNKALTPGVPPYNNLGGSSNSVTSYVDYNPFSVYPGIGIDGCPVVLNLANPTASVAFKYLGVASGPLFGYSMTFAWDDTKVKVNSVTEGSLLLPVTVFKTTAIGTNMMKVDVTRLNQVSGGVIGPGTMFTVVFEAINLGVCGSSPITVALIKARDPQNAELTGIITTDCALNIDMTAPTVTGVHIANETVRPVTLSDDYAKTGDQLKVTATVGDNCTPLLTTARIVANFSTLISGGLAADPADTYTGGIATWTRTGTLLGDGSRTVTVTATDWLGNPNSASDAIYVDNTPPVTPASALYAEPKHQNVQLAWTVGSDAQSGVWGYMIKQNPWTTYPGYTGPAPAYPALSAFAPAVGIPPYAAGGTDFQVKDPSLGTSYLFPLLPRGISYFTIATFDWALNYSLVASGPTSSSERATNYFLGDFGSGGGLLVPGAGYDGSIGGFDLGYFSHYYWFTSTSPTDGDGHTWADAIYGDIGPTAGSERTHPIAGHRFGIPVPDLQIEFEDLMIFSMNYANVPKLSPPEIPAYSNQFALNMRTKSEGQELVVSVKLENNRTAVKGASLSLLFDPQYLKVKNVQSGSLFGAEGSQAFFAHREDAGMVRFDASTMGIERTVEYSGDIATVRFEVLGDGDPGLAFSSVKLRDGDNKEIPVRLKTSSAIVPVSNALSQNYPNPFNPSSMISYQVAEAGTVTIDVYNALGAKVMTLVNGTHEAGSYQALLDASSLSSGLYYYTMRAGSFTATRSMTVVK